MENLAESYLRDEVTENDEDRIRKFQFLPVGRHKPILRA